MARRIGSHQLVCEVTTLDINLTLPGLEGPVLEPHREVAVGVIRNLTRAAGVRAIYLEGSLARGTADAYSDVDILVILDSGCRQELWNHRHQIVEIPPDRILDLDHQWGAPSMLSYAVLYETGVYLDLTLVESPHVPSHDAALMWSATTPAADGDGPLEGSLNIPLDSMDDTLRMFWMGSPLCAKYLVRRQLWTALWFVESRRALFLKAWRLAHTPSRADWGFTKVHEDVPKEILNALALTVTPLGYAALANSLVGLMSLMQHYGPQLAQRYGVEYPEIPAATIAQKISQRLDLE